MAFLIRTIDHTAAGRKIVRDREIASATITIGRASDNDIHLPDLAVEQYHLTITNIASDRLEIGAVGTLGFAIDGQTVAEAVLDPNQGAEIALGASLLMISADPSGATTITIRQSEKGEGAGDAVRGFSPASVFPSKRAMSWILAGLVLCLFLAVPIASHLLRAPTKPDADKPGQVMLDESWSTGDLSMAHHGLEDNCEACHTTPFVSVRDQTCLTCHDNIKDHAKKPRLAIGSPPVSSGDKIQWDIAQALGKEGPGACTTCHTEHEGPTKQKPAKEAFCADCHDALDTRLTDTAIGNASDFGKKHPQFEPALFTEYRQKKPVRVSLDDRPEELSGLKFPHDLHLNPQGGAARMAISLGTARGYGEPLQCSNCHMADKSGVGFAPVKMESACESCHSLVYGNQGGTFQSLRHGNIQDIRADLAKASSIPPRKKKPLLPGRRRPGYFGSEVRDYPNFGPPASSMISMNMALQPSGVCSECHFPTQTAGKADVIPVNLPDRFLWHGYFSHAAHSQEKCSDCHKAEGSKSARDLLIPGIAVCRDCHEGETAIKADVPSSCSTCHSYHAPSRPWRIEYPKTRITTISGNLTFAHDLWERHK